MSVLSDLCRAAMAQHANPHLGGFVPTNPEWSCLTAAGRVAVAQQAEQLPTGVILSAITSGDGPPVPLWAELRRRYGAVGAVVVADRLVRLDQRSIHSFRGVSPDGYVSLEPHPDGWLDRDFTGGWGWCAPKVFEALRSVQEWSAEPPPDVCLRVAGYDLCPFWDSPWLGPIRVEDPTIRARLDAARVVAAHCPARMAPVLRLPALAGLSGTLSLVQQTEYARTATRPGLRREVAYGPRSGMVGASYTHVVYATAAM